MDNEWIKERGAGSEIDRSTPFSGFPWLVPTIGPCPSKRARLFLFLFCPSHLAGADEAARGLLGGEALNGGLPWQKRGHMNRQRLIDRRYRALCVRHNMYPPGRTRGRPP